MIAEQITLGVGTWAWGDRLIWGYNSDYDAESLYAVFRQALQDNVFYFACNESFAEGQAESILGEFCRKTTHPVLISSKFTPRFWRLDRKSFLKALRGSLRRLQRSVLDIYEVMPPRGRMNLSALAECCAEALDQQLVRQVGVSNFNAEQIDVFSEQLRHFGYSVACLETEYSLLDRRIEVNGVMTVCRDHNITVVAQNPLAMGYLTGKFDPKEILPGSRGRMMEKYRSVYFELLLRTLNNIGMEMGGASSAQVALNWLISKGAIPIPGAKQQIQVAENNDSLRYHLTAEQVHILDEVSRRPGRIAEEVRNEA